MAAMHFAKRQNADAEATVTFILRHFIARRRRTQLSNSLFSRLLDHTGFMRLSVSRRS
jgi:hypothetical protein